MTLDKTLINLRKFGWFKNLKDFSIKTKSHKESKKIVDSLVFLGFKNPVNFKGNANFGFYNVENKIITECSCFSDFKIIKLSDIPYK